MISVAFPRMFDSRQTIFVQDHEATLQSLKLLLLSEAKEFIIDPEYGTHLKKLIYEKGNLILVDIIVDDIYQAIRMFMPQISINREDIEVTVDKRDIYVKISCRNLLNYQIDLYEIKLTNTEEQ